MSEICALLLTIMAIVAICLSVHDDDPLEANRDRASFLEVPGGHPASAPGKLPRQRILRLIDFGRLDAHQRRGLGSDREERSPYRNFVYPGRNRL